MSADNWAVCPKCKQELEYKYKNAYGKLPEKEFLDLWVEYQLMLRGNSATLREDYEAYICNGVFEVSYYAKCEKCGFEFSYSHKQEV